MIRNVGDALPALCWLARPDGALFWYNTKWYAYTGTTPEEMAGDGWRTVIHPETLPSVEATWRRCIETGEGVELTFPLRGADGVYRPFLTRVVPIRGRDERVAGWIGINVDVAAQSDVEAALRESEERFRRFLEFTRDGVVIHDGTTVLDCTESYARMFGYAGAAELIGRPISDLVTLEGLAALEDRNRSGNEEPYETTARRKDGTPFPAEFVGKAIEWRGRRARVGVARDLSDRRRAEALLEERAAVLGQLVEGVILTDAEGRIVFMNDAAARLHGFSRLGIEPEDYTRTFNLLTLDGTPYPPDRLPLSRAVRGEVVSDERWRIRRPDGTEVLAIGTARPLLDNDGRQYGAVLTLRDDTVRHEAEQALRESEERFRQLAESVDQVFYVLQMGGERKLIYVSPAYERVWGRPAEPILLDIGEFARNVHPDDRDRFRAEVQLRETGKPVTIEYRIVRPDGAVRWIRDRSYPVADAANPLARAVGVAEDVTERKQVEASLQRLTETLSEQVEARTRERNRVWELSQDLFASARFDGYLEAINPAFPRILGHSEAELLGRPLVDFVHPDDRADSAAAIAGLQRSGVIDRYENRMLCADGTFRWISWSAAAEGDRYYAVGRDITREKEREEQLRQIQKMEAVGQLTGGIAHDFNNLLMIVSAGLDMLDRSQDPARRARVLTGMRQAVDRGSKLSRQLLAFSRRQSLRPEPVDVAERVGGMRELLDRSLRGDIQVVTRFPAGLWPVEVDPGELELVILNLAVNARDAMPDGGVVTISAENLAGLVDGEIRGDFVRLTVEDTGRGMAPEVASRAFEPFFTTKDVGKGSGLGLAQTHGFARASGGVARIASRPGHGTSVSLYLPRSQKRPMGVVRSSLVEADGLPAGHAGQVLLVEDDNEVAALTGELFQQLGFETLRVAGPEAALGALADGRPVDLVFSDIMMPGAMNGVELAHEIRRRRPDLPVLLTSGYAEAVQRGAPAEAFPLLPKPYRLADLGRALTALGFGGEAGGAGDASAAARTSAGPRALAGPLRPK